jgi:hypothetical protein
VSYRVEIFCVARPPSAECHGADAEETPIGDASTIQFAGINARADAIRRGWKRSRAGWKCPICQKKVKS